MENLTKTIIFDGGPLHNEFRIVHRNVSKLEYHEHPPISAMNNNKTVEENIIKRYYIATDKYYNGIQVFTVELKPKENESDNEVAQAT